MGLSPSRGNFETILSIELLAAAQAYEFKERAGRAPATERVYRQLREVVAPYSDDRPVASDIGIAVRFLRQAATGAQNGLPRR